MTGIDLIAQERDEQIYKHGYTVTKDLQYKKDELIYGAYAYLTAALTGEGIHYWPFNSESFKEGDRVSYLKKAGAFIAAELDRLLAN